jgi:hypothetical protein
MGILMRSDSSSAQVPRLFLAISLSAGVKILMGCILFRTNPGCCMPVRQAKNSLADHPTILSTTKPGRKGRWAINASRIAGIARGR